jgi:hypothetical protein
MAMVNMNNIIEDDAMAPNQNPNTLSLSGGFFVNM